MNFLDMGKAFDRILRDELWEHLVGREVNKKLIRVISRISRNTSNIIISQNRSSKPFVTKYGQYGQSPLLFIIFIDQIITDINSKILR